MALGPTMIDRGNAHVDLLGREISVGDFVVAPYHNGLNIYSVFKLTPKMIKISKIGGSSGRSIYAKDSLKVDPNELTMYLLKKGK